MRFSLTTWNINSVRLRIDLVAKFLKSVRPDVLCLQETKCIDDAFPLKRFKRLGYEHVALNGQKGYHGVAVISKLPFETTDIRTFCDKIDSRHISVAFGEKAQLSSRWCCIFLCSGRRRYSRSLRSIRSSSTSCGFSTRERPASRCIRAATTAISWSGDLNVAPHENDVWSHKQLLKVVSHTPIECEKLLAAQTHGEWVDVARERIPFSCVKGLYVVELSRPDWTLGRSRPPARSHLGIARAQRGRQRFQDHAGMRAAGNGRPTTCR